ncbi:MAG: hypothetical protein HFJ09_11305 [Lachnospiraceae bacterium]|nr:hypothetical protein [Lachnospiraceae bacterium]
MGITDVVYNRYQQTQTGKYQNKGVKNQRTANNDMAERRTQESKTSEYARQNKVDRFEKTSKVETYDISRLSKEAQGYLTQLKEKYNIADVIVADYHTEEEANALMAGASKDYAIVITPELLEKMAAEEDTRTKYEEILDMGLGKMGNIKEELGEDADKVSTIGMTVDKEGKVKYFAVLDEQREQDAKRMEEQKEIRNKEKAEKKKAEEKEKLEEFRDSKSRIITADSIEELIKKIKERQAEEKEQEEQNMFFAKTAQEEANKGAKIDFSL